MNTTATKLHLPIDVTRCFGAGCAETQTCLRYICRKDDFPMLSYIQSGAFVDGRCIYKLNLNDKE